MKEKGSYSFLSYVRTPRRLYRLTQILQVLAKQGFGHMVFNLKLHTYLPVGRRFVEKLVVEEHFEEETLPQRLVNVCQELGPTFVKFGQILSTRPDIVPESYVKEFSRLQKGVKPFDSEEAKKVIESELKAPIDKFFSFFDDEPAASGSVAQVHNARLMDGTEVVVKVKRPGIDKLIKSDLDLLSFIVKQAEKFEEIKTFNPVMVYDELFRAMKSELDFITEASYTAKFHQRFKDWQGVRIPCVFWNLCTSNVLTIERLSDLSIGEMLELEECAQDKKEIAANLITIFLEQYFSLGFFHADPHPGNILVSEDGVLELVDFGIVGYMSDELRHQILASMLALSLRDLELFVDILINIGKRAHPYEKDGLRFALIEMIGKFYGIPINKIDIKRAFVDSMKIIREYSMVLPRDFVLFSKSFITIMGLIRQLDPEFDIITMIKPATKKLIRERVSPGHLKRSLTGSSWHVINYLRQIPKDAGDILKKGLDGNLELGIKHLGLSDLFHVVDKASNRLSLSITLGCIVVASSLVMMAKVGPTIAKDISILGVFGYFIAMSMGLWLAYGILRSGRL
ncbi:MAG: ubiquinone biosynthesis protein [Candidatus Scalindua rubra]|uniref:Ubiquinone biosynthesis protein n=1 Tax=Candidatus Scalindua rubra TaxID=1872076 RepID=A0A1E3X436_9BACT|nr:MAG: ubiquinone biosynthesis protein [Candidatus Scalindua rubra]